jgi:Ca-activated chloride channel family protein
VAVRIQAAFCTQFSRRFAARRRGALFATRSIPLHVDRRALARIEVRRLMTLPRVSVALIVTAIVSGGVSTARAQEPAERPTFSTSVALVPITAVVRDARSRIVRGLARDDFQVLENSQPRRILEFKATTDGPVSVGLLFDTSGSMRGTALGRGRTVVERLLTQMNPASDEIALFTFDKRLRQDTPFVAQASAIRGALEGSRAWGTTSLYDAIADAARRVSDRASSRRALVVVTDGLDTSSTMTPADVSAMASAIDVPVYILPVYTPKRQPPATSVTSGESTE